MPKLLRFSPVAGIVVQIELANILVANHVKLYVTWRPMHGTGAIIIITVGMRSFARRHVIRGGGLGLVLDVGYAREGCAPWGRVRFVLLLNPLV